MRNLDLDFHRVPRPSAVGWMLFVAGLGLVAALAGMHHALDRETAREQVLLDGLAPLPAQRASAEAASSGDDAALAAAQQALARAKRPWGSLFGPLETADGQDMAVLSITPDSARGLVKIHAEARHLAAMLAYQQRLQADASLREVILLDHELVPGGAEAPVRFHLSVRWGGSRVGP